MAGRIAKYEADLAILTQRKDALTAEVDAEQSKCEALYTPEKLLELVTGKSQSPDLRLRLKTEIAKRISRIDIEFKDRTPIQATITLINGFLDFILFRA